jgi:hypothetical protein
LRGEIENLGQSITIGIGIFLVFMAILGIAVCLFGIAAAGDGAKFGGWIFIIIGAILALNGINLGLERL